MKFFKIKFCKNIIFPFVLSVFVLLNCNLQTDSKKNHPELLFYLLLNSSASIQSIPEDSADHVVYSPSHTGEGYYDKNKAINSVRGSGCCSGSSDVFSLSATGIGTSIVLEWKEKKVINGSGIDFIVFENPFRINGNSSSVFMEPVIVEVSLDNVNYCGFKPDYSNSNESAYSNNPAHWNQFAGISPVFYNEETNRLTKSDLYDLSKSGGDGFNLDNLSPDNSFEIGCSSATANEIKSNGFVYLRLTSATNRTNVDSGLKFPKDSGAIDGPDIDGVFARYRLPR